MADSIEGKVGVDPEREFECCECDRLIWNALGVPDHHMCALCLFIPGWHTRKDMAALFDPSYVVKEQSDG